MNDAELSHRLTALNAVAQFNLGMVEAFTRTLRDAPDEALFRLSVPAWAAEHRMDEVEAIELFVTAAHVGILDLSWGISCPLCMGFLGTHGGLKSLRGGKWCAMCQLTAPPDLDERVEVTFTVNPSVRAIRFHDLDSIDNSKDLLHAYFASALASDAPLRGMLGDNVLSISRLEAGSTVNLPLDLALGWHAVFVPSLHTAFNFKAVDDSSAPAVLEVEVLEDQMLPPRGVLRAKGGTLRVRNRLSRTLAYVLLKSVALPPEERPPGFTLSHPQRPYLSGKRMMTTQAFLELFRADSIPAQGGLDVRSLTLLFTDLKGSTDLYERVGDLRAFDLVMKHFDVLREIVRRHGGAVVKTIGDAVMASFAQPLEALAAAQEMQREVGKVSNEIVLKVGLHAGGCIAVELNERLDYFGQTVNTAARVQGLAEPGEIVCTATIYATDGASNLLEGAGLRGVRESAHLKGIHGDVPVVRLRPAP